MMRLIDGNGNQIAIPMDKESVSVREFVMDKYNIEEILRNIFIKPASYVMAKLLDIKYTCINDICIVVGKILEEAAICPEICGQFVELTRLLAESVPTIAQNHKFTCQLRGCEIITKVIVKEFWNLAKSKEPIIVMDTNRDHGAVKFIAKLYDVGLIVDEQLHCNFVLLSSRQKRHENMILLMKKLKSPVLKRAAEASSIACDPKLPKMLEFLKKQGIIEPKIMLQALTQNDYEFESSSDSSDESFHDAVEDDSIISSSSNDNSTNQNPQPSSSNQDSYSIIVKNTLKNRENSNSESSNTATSSSKIKEDVKEEKKLDFVDQFAEHLNCLRIKKESKFNIQNFRSCSESNKKKCAVLMLKSVLDDSSHSKTYAELVLKILQLGIPSNGQRKNFNIHLKEACDFENINLCKQVKNEQVYWLFLENFGIFLSELYVIDAIKIQTFNKWLEETKKLALENDIAVKILMQTFKIFHMHMRKKYTDSHLVLLRFLGELKQNDRIPSQDAQWLDEILNGHTAKNIDKTAKNEQISESSSSTGAIKKSSSELTVKSMEVFSTFNDYLTKVNHQGHARYENYEISDFSEQTLQSCSDLFIEYCLNFPKVSSKYIKILKKTVFPAFPSDEIRKTFKSCLRKTTLHEMKKIIRVDRVASSNWTRVGRFSCCICELFDESLMSLDVLQDWMELLGKVATEDNPEADREHNAFLILFGPVLKRKNKTKDIDMEYKDIILQKLVRMSGYVENNEQESLEYKNECEEMFEPKQTEENVHKIVRNKRIDEKCKIIRKPRPKNSDVKLTAEQPDLCESNIEIKKNNRRALKPKNNDPDANENFMKIIQEITLINSKNLPQRDLKPPPFQVTAEMTHFTIAFLQIYDHSMETLFELFSKFKIETDDEFEDFLRFYFYLLTIATNMSSCAAITKELCLELSHFNFRERIERCITTAINEVFWTFENRNDTNDDTMMIMYAEFYNYEIVTSYTFIKTLYRLFGTGLSTHTYINTVHTLMYIVGYKMIENSDGTDFVGFFDNLDNLKSWDTGSEGHRRYENLMKLLRCVYDNSAMRYLYIHTQKLTFEKILDNLTDSNVEISIRNIERLDCFKVSINACIFYRKCCQNMTNVKNLVRVLKRSCELHEELISFIRTGVIVHFGSLIGNTKEDANGNSSVLDEFVPKIRKSLVIIAEILHVGLIHFSYMDLIFKFMIEKPCENKLRCLGFLFGLIGPKMELEKPDKIDGIFEKIESCMRSQKVKELVEKLKKFRTNNWKWDNKDDEDCFADPEKEWIIFSEDEEIKPITYNKMMYEFEEDKVARMKARRKRSMYSWRGVSTESSSEIRQKSENILKRKFSSMIDENCEHQVDDDQKNKEINKISTTKLSDNTKKSDESATSTSNLTKSSSTSSNNNSTPFNASSNQSGNSPIPPTNSTPSTMSSNSTTNSSKTTANAPNSTTSTSVPTTTTSKSTITSNPPKQLVKSKIITKIESTTKGLTKTKKQQSVDDEIAENLSKLLDDSVERVEITKLSNKDDDGSLISFKIVKKSEKNEEENRMDEMFKKFAEADKDCEILNEILNSGDDGVKMSPKLEKFIKAINSNYETSEIFHEMAKESMEPEKPSTKMKEMKNVQNIEEIQKNFSVFEKKESDYEIFLRNFENSPESKVNKCQEMSQMLTKNDDIQIEFLQNVWKFCLMDASVAGQLTEICKKLAAREDLKNFRKNVENFVKNRISSLQKISSSASVDEATRKRIVNAILFIAELFVRDLISDGILQSCLVTKITNQMNCKEIPELLSIISDKIERNEESVELQARIIGLESLQQEKYMEIVAKIKGDLIELGGH